MKAASLAFASVIWPSLAPPLWARVTENLLISACRKSNGSFALIIMTTSGKILREILLQGRGHDFAHHQPSGSIVALARRPGRFALAFNASDNTPPILFAPPTTRHFYGHGTFSSDGRLLFATENDFDHARGVIGIYDATAGFSRIGELPSHGVGPHDILLMPDGKTLVVANGGIETHPASGRNKLNIATMQPALCFIDIATGDLVTRHVLENDLHHLSIRHLTSDGQGNIWFGCQWQGPHDQVPGLIGRARMDAPLRLVEAAQSIGSKLKGYIGSVTLSADGRWLAASAPRAGRIVYLDTESPGILRTSRIADGCGLAPLGRSKFAISSGHGVLQRESPPGDLQNTTTLPALSFDNHMRAIN